MKSILIKKELILKLSDFHIQNTDLYGFHYVQLEVLIRQPNNQQHPNRLLKTNKFKIQQPQQDQSLNSVQSENNQSLKVVKLEHSFLLPIDFTPCLLTHCNNEYYFSWSIYEQNKLQQDKDQILTLQFSLLDYGSQIGQINILQRQCYILSYSNQCFIQSFVSQFQENQFFYFNVLSVLFLKSIKLINNQINILQVQSQSEVQTQTDKQLKQLNLNLSTKEITELYSFILVAIQQLNEFIDTLKNYNQKDHKKTIKLQENAQLIFKKTKSFDDTRLQNLCSEKQIHLLLYELKGKIIPSLYEHLNSPVGRPKLTKDNFDFKKQIINQLIISKQLSIKQADAIIRLEELWIQLPLEYPIISFFINQELHQIVTSIGYIREFINHKTHKILPNENTVKKQVIFLFHGYGGNKHDFDYIKNYLRFQNKNSFVHALSSYSDMMESSIQTLGQTAAEEINSFLKNNQKINQVSFISFSLGGLISRASMPYIDSQRIAFKSYISLASPHLGIYLNQNRIFSFGVSILSYFKKTDSLLNELALRDQQFLENTYLYLLSEKNSLSQFKNTILIGALEDDYAPYESALLIKGELLQTKSQQYIQIEQMRQNLLKQLHNTTLIRTLIYFNKQDSMINNIIGKKRHLEFLINPSLIEILFTRY